MPKTSDLFVRCLEAEGITTMLGVPGEENADLLLSLEDSDIRVIHTRHEQGAAFAASAYARLTGKPLAVLATLGPGASNLLTGVADANMDNVPIIAIIGQGSSERLHKESHQIMDAVSMYRPVTKWATSVRTPESVPETVRKAVRLATAEKPGAVLIELPEDVAAMDADGSPLEPRTSPRPDPAADSIAQAADRLLDAERPVILAGNGVIRGGASPHLRRLAETHRIPVVSTFMGKGVIDRSSPHCLFTVGIQEHDQVVCLLREADVVLAVGYDLVEYPPASWVSDSSSILHVDFEPGEIDAAYRPAVEVTGDIASALDALADRLARADRAVQPHPTAQAVRQELLREFEAHAGDRSESSIPPQKLLWDTRSALAPEDVLLSGVGAHKMWIGRQYQCNEPNTCLIPNGFCSMGQALPGLIGAKLARPAHRCVAVCGDGDFLMNVQEMETISRLALDVTAIVWEDQSYGLIAWKQEADFGRHTELSFTNPDWLQLAASFGWHAETVADSDAFAPALDRALQHRGPALVVARVDYRENMRLTERLGKQTCRI